MGNNGTTVWNQTGGLFDWSDVSGGEVGNGDFGWGSGTANMNISGGTFQTNTQWGFKFSDGANTTWNIGGGASQALVNQLDGNGALIGRGGVVTINLLTNGTLQMQTINTNPGWPGAPGTALNFNGGTLRAQASAEMLGSGAIQGAYVMEGGGTLDNNGFNPSFSTPLNTAAQCHRRRHYINQRRELDPERVEHVQRPHGD